MSKRKHEHQWAHFTTLANRTCERPTSKRSLGVKRFEKIIGLYLEGEANDWDEAGMGEEEGVTTVEAEEEAFAAGDGGASF